MRGRRNSDNQKQRAQMLPPCRVCGQKGAGFHYGVTTCEACKGFFRRSLVRNKPYECIGSQQCYIGPSTSRRHSCPKCRYEKCTAVGMSKSAIKTGRYSLMKKSKDIYELLLHQESSSNENHDETFRTRLKETLAKIRRAKLRMTARKPFERSRIHGSLNPVQAKFESSSASCPSGDIDDSSMAYHDEWKPSTSHAFKYYENETSCAHSKSYYQQNCGLQQPHSCCDPNSTDIDVKVGFDDGILNNDVYQAEEEYSGHNPDVCLQQQQVVYVQSGHGLNYQRDNELQHFNPIASYYPNDTTNSTHFKQYHVNTVNSNMSDYQPSFYSCHTTPRINGNYGFSGGLNASGSNNWSQCSSPSTLSYVTSDQPTLESAAPIEYFHPSFAVSSKVVNDSHIVSEKAAGSDMISRCSPVTPCSAHHTTDYSNPFVTACDGNSCLHDDFLQCSYTSGINRDIGISKSADVSPDQQTYPIMHGPSYHTIREVRMTQEFNLSISSVHDSKRYTQTTDNNNNENIERIIAQSIAGDDTWSAELEYHNEFNVTSLEDIDCHSGTSGFGISPLDMQCDSSLQLHSHFNCINSADNSKQHCYSEQVPNYYCNFYKDNPGNQENSESQVPQHQVPGIQLKQ